MTFLIAAVLAVLSAISCASVRISRSSQAVSQRQDSLIVDYIRSELETGQIELETTRIEFYPSPDTLRPCIRNPTAGPVKSITLTKIHATSEKEVSVDSSSVAGSKAEEHSEEEKTSDAEVNEPPTATKFNTTLKSIAWILGLLLVGYIVIRIRIARAKK